MINMKQNLKVNNIIFGILAVVIGILLVAIPVTCINAIVIILGFGAIADGIYNLIQNQSLIESKTFRITILTKSISSILVGVLAIVLPLAFAGTFWTVMVYVLAVYLVVFAIMGFYAAYQIKKTGASVKDMTLRHLGCLIGAVLLFIIPTKTLGIFILRLIGIVLILLGIIFLFLEWHASRKEIVVEAESVVDVKTETVETPVDSEAKTTEAEDTTEKVESKAKKTKADK